MQILSYNYLLLNGKDCNWHWKCLLVSTDLALFYRLQKTKYVPRSPLLPAESATSNREEQITHLTVQSNMLQVPARGQHSKGDRDFQTSYRQPVRADILQLIRWTIWALSAFFYPKRGTRQFLTHFFPPAWSWSLQARTHSEAKGTCPRLDLQLFHIQKLQGRQLLPLYYPF